MSVVDLPQAQAAYQGFAAAAQSVCCFVDKAV